MDTFATFPGSRIIPILNPVLPNLQFGRPEYQHLQCANELFGYRGTTALQPRRDGVGLLHCSGRLFVAHL